MSDRGPSGQDPDPTEFFPPLPPDAPPTGSSDLPPIGSERDPDPTRVMPPAGGEYEPTTAMPPTGGGPYDPGPPYGGGPGGPGGPGGDEPEFDGEPVPWYRQPGPLAALIAGIAAVVLGLIALLVWTADDDDTSDDTLPSISTSTTEAPSTTEATTPPTTTTTTVPDTTTSSTSTTTTTTTTTPPTTTPTTLPPTTTTQPPPPPTTTTTVTVVPPPQPGATLWDIISATPALSQFRAAIEGSGTIDLFDGSDEYTVLAPENGAFEDAQGEFDVNDYVIAGNLTSAELFALDDVEVESGATLAVSDAAQTVGGAVMTSSRDVEAANGYLNAIASFVTPE